MKSESTLLICLSIAWGQNRSHKVKLLIEVEYYWRRQANGNLAEAGQEMTNFLLKQKTSGCQRRLGGIPKGPLWPKCKFLLELQQEKL